MKDTPAFQSKDLENVSLKKVSQLIQREEILTELSIRKRKELVKFLNRSDARKKLGENLDGSEWDILFYLDDYIEKQVRGNVTKSEIKNIRRSIEENLL